MQVQETFAAEVKQLTLAHEQELERSRTSSFTEGRKIGLDQGISMGIRDCRSNFLMTPYGQAFLDSLVKRLPEAYLHSPDFWVRILDPLTDWAASVIFECCQQLGFPEQAAVINLGPIVRMFEMRSEALKRNCFLPTGEPWFMPVLREASEALCQPARSPEDLPAWDAPPFPLFPLNTMVMRFMKKAFDEELGEENVLGSSLNKETTSSVHTPTVMEGGSGEKEVLSISTDQPEGDLPLYSAKAPLASGNRALSSYSSGSEDPISVSDPFL